MMHTSRRPRLYDNLYSDATGFSTTGTETWRDIKADPKKRKKFVKPYILTTRKGVIISLYITPGYATDSPRFELLAKNIPKGKRYNRLGFRIFIKKEL